jgi:hypothetical protein
VVEEAFPPDDELLPLADDEDPLELAPLEEVVLVLDASKIVVFLVVVGEIVVGG